MTQLRPPQPDAFLLLLDAPQREAFHRLAGLLRGRGRTLADYHAAAVLIEELKPEGAGYGSGWVGELCAALGRQRAPLSPSLAYRLIRFAELYPGTKGARRVRQLGDKITWEVMMRVLAVEDAGKREGILRRAADEGLSSRAVIALVREKVGYRRARGGRPGPKPSTHPNRALKELRAWASKWPAVLAAWTGGDNPAVERTRRLKPGQITDAFLTDLAAVAALLGQMGKSAKGLAGELADLLRTLRKRRGEVKHDG